MVGAKTAPLGDVRTRWRLLHYCCPGTFCGAGSCPKEPEALKQHCTSSFSLQRDGIQRVFRAARDIILGATPASEPTGRPFDALRLDVVGVCGVTPAAYGLDSDRHTAAPCQRSDFAVLRDYDNGWAKAESEDGRRRFTALRAVEADRA